MTNRTRGRQCVLIVAALAASLGCVGAAEADEVAGIVAALEGNVRVEAADGSATQVTMPQALRTGDKLLIGKTARAVIFQRAQPPITLKPGTGLAIGRDPLTAKTGLESPAIAALWERLTFWLSIDRLKRLADADPSAVARETAAEAKPSNTCILTERPKFSWPRVSGARNYAFSITEVTETGEQRVYNAATANTQLAYPSSKPPLAPGKVYRWEAVGGDAGREEEPEGGWILLLPQEKVKAAQQAEKQLEAWAAAAKDHYAADLLLAERYCSDGLYELAHARLSKLARTEKTDLIVAAFLADVGTKRQRPPEG